jgi:uncharacterized damage-inducible protein DinB
MNAEEMRELVAFDAWANGRILGVAEALTPEQFIRPLGSSFSSVRDTLAHIYGAEWVWMERLQGRSPSGLPDAAQFSELAGLRERWAELEKRMLDYVRNMTQEELDEVMNYKTLSSGPGRSPRWQMIQHVVNHSTYHRGQVVTMLRQMGAKGVGTDLITFYRDRSATAGA